MHMPLAGLLLLVVVVAMFGIRSSSFGFTKRLRFNANACIRLSSSYKHGEVEPKWQKFWEENNVFAAPLTPGTRKKYILDMFPYPSGAGLHVGHPEGYTATDILSRYWRMRQYDVLHPMGWDAFGLPAEQHAISTGTHPAVTTQLNIETFKRQLKSLGFSYDWNRELSTTNEDYVRWTQWIFLQLFKHDLAYQSKVQVNWCPNLGTVLSNEEVIDGKSERGGHSVVRMPLRQWVLRITKYADRLEKDLEGLNWPEGTLQAQKQWIGRSDGFVVKFGVLSSNSSIEVFTTRLDTIMGVTYLVLAPEHPIVESLTTLENKSIVKQYQDSISSKSDLERVATGADRGKSGVPLGSFAVHPLTNETLPIWIADYVLGSYGSGGVMAVPAHDERDYEFARIHDLPVKAVIKKSVDDDIVVPFFDEGVVVNSGELLNGKSCTLARELFAEQLKDISAGSIKTLYKLRDWVFSRQRYWGEPIPIYFPVTVADSSKSPLEQAYQIDHDHPIPVDESELPIKLPDMEDFLPGNDPAGCLARAESWRFFKKDGKWFARETNTMPQWAGSCWYYLRFIDPNNKSMLFSKDSSNWLPVDIYVGGQEHAVLHLLYARFWHKFLYDIKVVDHCEPFTKLVHQGMILGSDGEKMSKSRGNVINPDDIVKEHGADALRLYEMFMGPLEAVKPWQTSQLIGVVRFRDKIYKLCQQSELTDEDGKDLLETHRAIKKVSLDIEKLAFNTAISTLMIYTNFLQSLPQPLPRKALKTLLLLVSPFAPHVAEECWQLLGESSCISKEKWPVYDESLCREQVSMLVVQINGKTRGKLEIEGDLDEDTLRKNALAIPAVARHLEGREVKNVIHIRGKILNLII